MTQSTIVQPVIDAPPILTVDSTTGNATTENSLWSLSAPASAADPLMLTGPGGAQITWLPTELVYRDSAGNFDYIVGSAPSSLTAYQAQATYTRTFPQASDVFAALNNRLKHWVVLDVPPRAPSSALGTGILFGVSGQLTGLTVAPGTYDTMTQDGFTLPTLVATDLLGTTVTGQYEVLSTTDSAGQPALQLFLWFPVSLVQTGVYPLTIDPTVIVASADSTQGAFNGRAVVRLSNDTLVAVALSGTAGTLVAYTSADNGQTWAPSTLVPSYVFASATQSGWSIASVGTTLYYLISDDGYAFCWAYDVAAGTTLVNQATIGTGSARSTNNGGHLAVDSNGTLHATWNFSYGAGGWNVMYSTSTDGGAQWASVTALTNGASGTNTAHATLALTAANNVILTWDDTSNNMYAATFNGSTWSTPVLVAESSNMANGSLVINANGVIYASFAGGDNFYVASSADNGAQWGYVEAVSTGENSVYHTLAMDPSTNNLYLFFEGYNMTVSGSYYQIGQVLYTASTGTWGPITWLTSNTTGSAAYPNALWSAFNANSSDAIRVIYQDNQANALQYFTDVLDSPPNPPTLAPEANFPATQAAAFAWTFNPGTTGDTQSAYELQIINASSSAVVLDTGQVASSTSSYTLAANTLTNGTSYQWRVNTWNQNGMEGTYSGYGSFACAAAPTVSLVTPAANASVASASLTVQWAYSDPANNAEASWRVQLYASGGTTLLADSGVVKGTGLLYTLPYTLANGLSYQVNVTATNSQGITSAVATSAFSVSFAPPTPATLTLTPDSTQAQVQVAIANGSTATSASTPAYIGTGNGTMSPPTTTNGTTNSANWVVQCTNATAPATFSVTVGGTAEGNATVGTAYTYNGVSFTISAGSTAFAVGDEFTFTTTAVPATGNDLYRSESGANAFIRIAASLPVNATYQDLSVTHGQAYDYYAVTRGNNGTTTQSATASTTGVTLTNSGFWLFAVNDPTGTLLNLPYYNASTYVSIDGTTPNTEQWTPQATTLQFAGRTDPVIQFGEQSVSVYTRGNVVCLVPNSQWPQVKALLQSGQVLCFRDGWGRKAFGVCAGGYTETNLLWGQLVDIVLTEVAYTEAV